jgi:hypothetical protein
MGRKIHHRFPDSVDELILRGNSDSEFGSTGHVHCIVVSREPKYGDGAPAKYKSEQPLRKWATHQCIITVFILPDASTLITTFTISAVTNEEPKSGDTVK